MTTYRADDARFLSRIGIRIDDSMCWHLEEKRESDPVRMLGGALLAIVIVGGCAGIVALWMAVL